MRVKYIEMFRPNISSSSIIIRLNLSQSCFFLIRMSLCFSTLTDYFSMVSFSVHRKMISNTCMNQRKGHFQLHVVFQLGQR